MAKNFFKIRFPHFSYSFEEYLELSVKSIEDFNDVIATESEREMLGIRKLNLQRMKRINKTYVVSEKLCSLMEKIESPQIWMVITEDWCGDSAQNLPYIAKIAECSKLIVLKIIERDKYLDIMDEYLTDGTRSIPKVIASDVNGNELFLWGPRPKEAVELVKNAIQQGLEKNEWQEKLHKFYSDNKGQNLENEFIEIYENM